MAMQYRIQRDIRIACRTFPWCRVSSATLASSFPTDFPARHMDVDLNPQFQTTVRANHYNATILQRLPELGLNDAFLTAGCLFQSVWNAQAQRPLTEQISDYDVFYHDAQDLSWGAEDIMIQRAAIMFADLPIKVEVRNQARVHLWYPEKFGRPYPALQSCREGIDRFLAASSCVGLELATGEIYAPYGLQELYDGVLKINPHYPDDTLFLQKAISYQQRWPWLQIVLAEMHDTDDKLE